MKKRTKIIILSLMIVLLGVTGYLNIVLNNNITSTTTTTTTSMYVSYRNDRETLRDQQILYYDAIIDNESSSEEAVKKAEEAKMQLIENMGKEFEAETAVKNCGFSDCIVSITDPNVNVVVQCASITNEENMVITDAVRSALQIDAKYIIIIPAE